jgi:DNA repair protein RadC
MHNKPTVKDALKWSVTALDVLSKAADLIGKKLNRNSVFNCPQATKDFLTYKLAPHEREVFCVLFLGADRRACTRSHCGGGNSSVVCRTGPDLILYSVALAGRVVRAHNPAASCNVIC